jgi:glutamate/tyrosine decarboxylase-like PLP-dependent enzyme
MSIPKAVALLGIGRENVRRIPVDASIRMIPGELEKHMRQDLAARKTPVAVVASAGTVSTGSIDPLREMAEIAHRNGAWFHIDGAYGALAAIAEHDKFAGLELADSISLDPHKWLYTPVDCGCLLLHDRSAARKPFVAEGEYVKIHETAALESYAFWDYGIELSRRFRALKVWMTLRYYGARRIAAAIADDMAMARYMAERIENDPEFELLAPVPLSICCFRYVPASLRAQLTRTSGSQVNSRINQLNERIMHRVQRSGRAYVSNAMLRGKFALRACIINFRTTRADIDLTLEVIRQAAREIEKDEQPKLS